MKKIILLLALSLCFTNGYSQKKKSTKKAGTPASVLAKMNDLSAQLTPKKDRFEVLFGKDTLFTRKIDLSGNNKPTTKNNNIPTTCTITPVVVKGTPLYCITWSDNNINEVTEKKEDRTKVYSEIWNPVTKTQVLANVQTTTKITEILWLDKGKNASQTSEKLRREGFEFSMNKEGDVVLKNKTQENKMVYNPTTNVYEDVKSSSPTAKTKKK
ncbi:MAG TPA: hypothetical protein PLI38_11145 [Flavobacterium sp.]|mgnify:CR=1 FL=1|nr:hypothetical protein [Flavobacterium sp.]